MDLFRAQSVKFGTTIYTETISKIGALPPLLRTGPSSPRSRADLSERPFKYWREGEEDNPPETADTVIIATGASARRLNLPGEDTYWQSGISACAVCDGAVPIFRNKPLAVIGGGDSACEEGQYLTKVRFSAGMRSGRELTGVRMQYASHVYVLVRRDQLRASKVMAKRLMSHPKVTILWNSEPVEAKGDGVRSSFLSLLLHSTDTNAHAGPPPIHLGSQHQDGRDHRPPRQRTLLRHRYVLLPSL